MPSSPSGSCSALKSQFLFGSQKVPVRLSIVSGGPATAAARKLAARLEASRGLPAPSRGRCPARGERAECWAPAWRRGGEKARKEEQHVATNFNDGCQRLFPTGEPTGGWFPWVWDSSRSTTECRARVVGEHGVGTERTDCAREGSTGHARGEREHRDTCFYPRQRETWSLVAAKQRNGWQGARASSFASAPNRWSRTDFSSREEKVGELSQNTAYFVRRLLSPQSLAGGLACWHAYALQS